MSCRATRDLLHRDATALDEAQRLRLDDHLATCETCRGDRARLRLVREVAASLPVKDTYHRAIARALLEGAPAARGAPAPRRARWLWPLAAAAVAGVLAFALIPATRPLAPRIVARTAPGPVAGDNPIAGDNLIVGPAIVKRPAMQLALADGARARLAGRTVVLELGRVEIEATGEPARVITERFEVELADGAAGVDAEGVQVTRGSARVTDRTHALLAQLASGSEWQPGFVDMPPDVVTRPRRAGMAQARGELAAGKPAEAERTAEAVLARASSRSEEAEVRMFLADLAASSGNLAVAVARYEAVATKFPELPTAESALYAAARIELRRQRAAAARDLFDRYLARYPSGRYADDVRRLRRTE